MPTYDSPIYSYAFTPTTPMPSLEDSVPNAPVIMLVGPAGSGKTTFMTRLVRPDKSIFILDADKNLAGPKKVATAERRSVKNVLFDHIDVENGQPVPPLLQYQRAASLLTTAIKDPTVGTIGITSTTTLVEVFKNEVRRQQNKGTDYAFQIQDWGRYAALWQGFVATLRACGKPVVIDGHVTAEKGELETFLRWALAIPGTTGTLLPMMVTDFWKTSVESVLVGTTSTTKYMIETVQNSLWPNLKASLTLPPKFEANQEWANKIVEQFPS